MSTVEVKWKDLGEGMECDFCSGPLLVGLVPVVDITAFARGSDTLDASVFVGGDHALCQTCQGKVGIQASTQEVELAAIRLLHQEACAAITLERYPQYVGRLRSTVFGAG